MIKMITHTGTQAIKTKRLTLRRFTTDDAEEMFKNWASDERVTRFLTWSPHRSPEESRAIIENWIAAYSDVSKYNWLIEFEGKSVGSIAVVRMSEKSEHAELGYCLGFDFWGKGIMTEAAGAVIDYLFEKVNVNRVGISHAVKNPGSGRVAQKCGLTFEGVNREYFKSAKGEFLDIANYGILRREWEEKKK